MNAPFKNMLTMQSFKDNRLQICNWNRTAGNYEPKIRHHFAIILFGNNLSGIRTPYHVAEGGHPTADTFWPGKNNKSYFKSG